MAQSAERVRHMHQVEGALQFAIANIVTHNPNLAVVCDADQVVYASMSKVAGNAVTYETGALENPKITRHVTDVLEGTRWAFDVRESKYNVGD